MSVIDGIMGHDPAKWVVDKINELPNRAKYRAHNSVRFLTWASRIYEIGLPVPACYCALRASEEAVASFVSTAKISGYGDDAKINIRDHQAKATVSLLMERTVNVLCEYKPAVSCHPTEDTLLARITRDGEQIINVASVKIAHFLDGDGNISGDFYDDLVSSFGDASKLREAVLRAQSIRNKIFYADDKGIPTGFNTPEGLLARECQISLGLIWISIDINRNKGDLSPLIVQGLRTANMVIAALKERK